MKRLCAAPRGKRSRVPPAVPRCGDERCGRRRRPGAGSQALRPPSAKMEDAHFPCAAPSARAGHGTQRPLLRGLGERSPPSGAPVPLCPIHSSSSAQKRERERANTPPCLLQTVSVRVNHAEQCPLERASCMRKESGSSRRRHFQPGGGSLQRHQPGEPAEQPCSRAAQKSLKGCLLPQPPFVRLVVNFHVWERPEIFYLLLSQQYI